MMSGPGGGPAEEIEPGEDRDDSHGVVPGHLLAEPGHGGGRGEQGAEVEKGRGPRRSEDADAVEIEQLVEVRLSLRPLHRIESADRRQIAVEPLHLDGRELAGAALREG